MFNTSKNKSSNLVLKPCKSAQETSEEWLFIKAGHIPDRLLSIELDSCSTNTIYRARQLLNKYYLSRSRQLLNRYYLSSSIATWQILSIENYEIRIFRSDIQPILMYLCKVSFLTILDIYKTYFKDRHIEEYKENTSKSDWCLVLSKRSYCVFAP